MAGRQLVVSTGDLDSASQQKAAAEMSLRSLQRCPRSSILSPLSPFASTGYRLRPRVTLGERSVCRCNPEACVIVGGRWVPADGSNSRRRAPLLEEAWPRSGDEAGCNPQLAADLALSWGYRWQEPLFCRVVCPRRATGSVIGSFEQRTVSRLEGLS